MKDSYEKKCERAMKYFISNSTESINAVSKKFDISRPLFTKYLKEYNIETKREINDATLRANIFSRFYIEHPELSFNEICKYFNYCSDTGKRYLKKNNIKRREDISKEKSKKNMEKAIKYYKNNKMASLSQTAKKFNVCRVTLKDRLIKLNISIHPFVEHLCKDGNYYESYTRDNKINSKLNDTFDEHFFDVINTEEKAYWLGFILADGSIRHNSSNLMIGLAIRDYDHLHRFKKAIKSNSCIKEYKTSVLKNTQKSYDACSISITSKIMVDALNSHNIFERKTMNEKPDYSIPDQLVCHYIRGFIDGDGWISLYNRSANEDTEGVRVEVGVGSSYEMISYIASKLNYFLDINTLKISNMYSDFYTTETTNITDAIKILQFLYANAKIYLPRKYERALEVCRLHSMSLENVDD